MSSTKFNTRPRSNISIRDTISLTKVRLDILERALERGHANEAQNQLTFLYPHLVRLASEAPIRGSRERLIELFTDSMDEYSHEPTIDHDHLTLNGNFKLTSLMRKLLW